MSKALRSIKPDEKKMEVVKRRLMGTARGLGFLSAIDAAKKLNKQEWIPKDK